MEITPKDPKQNNNNLTIKGNAILKTFLPESLKNKPKSQVIQKQKESPSPQSEENLATSSEDVKLPGIQQHCQPESKPLARIAMVNNMLSKTTTEGEVVFLKRGSSGSSEGKRRRSIPHRITHSASDTACNQPRTAKPVTKKRRSMSDYLDMKKGKQSYEVVEKANMRMKLEDKQTHLGLEKKSEHMTTNPKIGESNKQQVKNKMNLLRGKLPNVTTWANKPSDTQTADIKQKEGKVDDTAKEKSEVKANTMRTRKTSADMIMNAFHKKVNTIPNIQSWKLNTFKHKDVPTDNLTKTEEMMKELMHEAIESKLENPDEETKEKVEIESFEHKKITLSVNKLTPIPSEEYQSDSDEENNFLAEKETPSSPNSLTSGRGILKKVSNVEIPNLVEEVTNLEAAVKVKEESNNSPSRMVKFDMPSFDSQTSEELPSITIDLYDVQESNIGEEKQGGGKFLFCDKSTETEAYKDDDIKTNNTEDDIFDHICSHLNINEMNKKAVIETLQDIFGILVGLETVEINPSNPSIEKSPSNKAETLAKLEEAIRMNFDINKRRTENSFESAPSNSSAIYEIDEDDPIEQVVLTHSLVLNNIDITLLENLKDQNGCNIKPQENPAEKDEQSDELESKVETALGSANLNQDYKNKKNIIKFPSCPELLRAEEPEYSNKAFAQIFVNHCEDEPDEIGKNEDDCGLDVHSPRSSDDSLQVDMDIIKNCLFIRETTIIDDFVML